MLVLVILLKKEQKSLTLKVNISKQNAKIINIRIFELREELAKVSLKVNEVTDKLKIILKIDPIVSIYRVGLKIANRPRHVIVLLRDICNKKKLLKRSTIIFEGIFNCQKT